MRCCKRQHPLILSSQKYNEWRIFPLSLVLLHTSSLELVHKVVRDHLAGHILGSCMSWRVWDFITVLFVPVVHKTKVRLSSLSPFSWDIWNSAALSALFCAMIFAC